MNQKRFSNAASTYDLHATPQQSLAQSLIDLLPDYQPSRILEIGSGTGIFTNMLHQKYPHAIIDAIDVAEAMITRSREQFKDIDQIRWMIADAEKYQSSQPYDLIASSATLHWATNLSTVLQNIFNNLKPEGIFILGIMLRGTLWELRELRKMIAPNKGDGLSLPMENIVERNIINTGFKIQKTKTNKEKVLYHDTRAFLRAIHEQGVTSIPDTATPLNRTELTHLADTYQKKYASIEGVYATYETAQYLLQKPLLKES